jgi:hypothetical protein
MRRRRLLWLVRGLAAITLVSFLVRRALAADAVAKLVDALEGSRSFKVRVQAAALLGRLHDPRAGQALARAALSDPHPVVRVVALKLLGKGALSDRVGLPIARQALTRAQGDRDPSVRRQATASLAELERAADPPTRAAVSPSRGGSLRVAVGSIGDRTGRASRGLRDRLRAEIKALLQREGNLQIAEAGEPGVGFLIDGTISKLSVSQGGRDVEAVCAIELVVSRPPRGIVTIASGEAIVQKPRPYYQAVLREKMELEAMENAARSAHENLARFLASQ